MTKKISSPSDPPENDPFWDKSGLIYWYFHRHRTGWATGWKCRIYNGRIDGTITDRPASDSGTSLGGSVIDEIRKTLSIFDTTNAKLFAPHGGGPERVILIIKDKSVATTWKTGLKPGAFGDNYEFFRGSDFADPGKQFFALTLRGAANATYYWYQG